MNRRSSFMKIAILVVFGVVAVMLAAAMLDRQRAGASRDVVANANAGD